MKNVLLILALAIVWALGGLTAGAGLSAFLRFSGLFLAEH